METAKHRNGAVALHHRRHAQQAETTDTIHFAEQSDGVVSVKVVEEEGSVAHIEGIVLVREGEGVPERRERLLSNNSRGRKRFVFPRRESFVRAAECR